MTGRFQSSPRTCTEHRRTVSTLTALLSSCHDVGLVPLPCVAEQAESPRVQPSRTWLSALPATDERCCALAQQISRVPVTGTESTGISTMEECQSSNALRMRKRYKQHTAGPIYPAYPHSSSIPLSLRWATHPWEATGFMPAGRHGHPPLGSSGTAVELRGPLLTVPWKVRGGRPHSEPTCHPCQPQCVYVCGGKGLAQELQQPPAGRGCWTAIPSPRSRGWNQIILRYFLSWAHSRGEELNARQLLQYTKEDLGHKA